MSVDMTTDALKRLAADNRDDPQYLAALGLMVLTGRTATSLVQRALGIGYNAAARIVERIEADGIISRPNSAGKRELIERREADAPVTAQGAEPVAWTGSGSLMALSVGREGFIWPTKADSHPIPLYAHPVTEGEAVPTCVACEDNPKHPNIPCAPPWCTPPQPSETVAEALREIRSAVQDGNLSQGVRLDIIDKIALRALKGGDA